LLSFLLFLGSCPLIAAWENDKKGRVMVVADQNIYGDVWIHYHDNFRHFVNVCEWLTKREKQVLKKFNFQGIIAEKKLILFLL
jgi:hypothetical protein